jgi:hypothetical protein
MWLCVSERERRETANIQWVRLLCDSLPQTVKNKNKEKGGGRPCKSGLQFTTMIEIPNQ